MTEFIHFLKRNNSWKAVVIVDFMVCFGWNSNSIQNMTIDKNCQVNQFKCFGKPRQKYPIRIDINSKVIKPTRTHTHT